MATAATIKKNIAKLEAALKSKATPKTLKPKLEAQLVKSKAELSGINKGTKPKTSSTKSTQTALQKLKEMVNKNKKYKTYKGAGVDLEKDADRPALRTGKRIAKESGKTYYEYRANRIDVKQPPKKYPKLEKGGEMAQVNKMSKDELKNWLSENYGYRGVDGKGITKELKDRTIENMRKEVLSQMKYNEKNNIKYAKGGYMAGITYSVKAENPYQLTMGVEATLGAYSKYEDLDPKAKKLLEKAVQELSFLKKYFYTNQKYMADGQVGYTIKSENPYQFIMGAQGVLSAYLRYEDLDPKAKNSLEVLLEDLEYLKRYFYNNKKYMADGGYMAKGGKVGMAEWAVTITSEDGESYDWDGFAKSEDDALDKAEKEAGFGSVESSVIMITDENGEKIEYAKGGLTEHGLKVGDTIVDDMFWDKSVKVLNSKTGYAVVKIETGERKEMKAMGGEMHRTQE
jgi:hypothetical protein